MALKPRTGNQYVISSGEWSAVVTELGASLRELKWRGEDLIVPFDPNKVIPCCNGWVLAPYPNRVTNGQYSFDGEDYQMPIDEFDRQSSLHGYAYRYMWELVDLQESHVTLSWRSPDIAGYRGHLASTRGWPTASTPPVRPLPPTTSPAVLSCTATPT